MEDFRGYSSKEEYFSDLLSIQGVTVNRKTIQVKSFSTTFSALNQASLATPKTIYIDLANPVLSNTIIPTTKTLYVADRLLLQSFVQASSGAVDMSFTLNMVNGINMTAFIVKKRQGTSCQAVDNQINSGGVALATVGNTMDDLSGAIFSHFQLDANPGAAGSIGAQVSYMFNGWRIDL